MNNTHRSSMALLCGTCALLGRTGTSNPEFERFRFTYSNKFRGNWLLPISETTNQI